MQIDGSHESGFRESVVGKIPEDWEVLELGEITVKTSNRDPRKYPDLQFRYVDVSSVSNEINRITDYALLPGHEAPSRARKIVSAGDTIFATVRPYLRNIAQISDDLDDSICSTGFCVLRADRTRLDDVFLFYRALTDSFVEGIVARQRGSSYPAVSDTVVKEQIIPLPPLPEQRRIAAVLNAIQDEIAAQDDLINALCEFKRSVMARLFTYGAGEVPAETKMTEVGEIPLGWEVSPLSAVLRESIKNGAFLKKELFGKGIPYLNVVDIFRDSHANLDLTERVQASASDIDKYGLDPGDLMFVRSSLKEEGVGHCCVVNDITQDSIFDNHLMRVRLNNEVAFPTFLAYFYLSPIGKSALISRSKKTTMTTLNQGGLAGSFIPIPPIEEQVEIAGHLRVLELTIAVAEDRKRALQDFFRSMLQQLMTGQIRLLSDEGLERLLNGQRR